MKLFERGQRVSLKKNLALKGVIDNVLPPHGGYQFYEVMLDDGSLETFHEHELINEVLVRTPWDLLSNNSLNDFRDFSIATTLHKVRNTTSNTISTLKASRTIFKPYQYKALVKFLKSDLKRILIADEVGLGKTIEAGHIVLEMAARGNLKNALIICTNSLKDKWKTEMQEKFNFVFKKYNDTNDLINDIKDDIIKSKRSIFGVLNYEKCRNTLLQEIIEENNYRFDLLICDEAHKIRNSETAQHKGVSKIVDISEAVIFLTATPIMTDIRNLHSLVRVLDREAYDTYDIFNNAIRQNRPFIQALSRLNAKDSLKVIANELDASLVIHESTADDEVFLREEYSIGQLFKDDELYKRARTRMIDEEDTHENRVKIQQDLIELNSLNHLYTRTRKKEVMKDEDVVSRNPKTISVSLSEEEQEIYDSVINQYDNPDNLGLMQRKRQMSSCIVAFQTLRSKLEDGKYDRSLPDAKFNAFKKVIDEVVIRKQKKIVVFAFFTNTLLYLRIKLRELSITSEIIYGGIDINERTTRIDRFQFDDNIKILLSSEVGSEGLDLQFCDVLINYDLPWNPMVVEQRIGRIDRVGQISKVINIYNLIIADTIEEKIHNRLYQRLNLFRESIGDLEEILGDTEPIGEIVRKGIESLYKTKLTELEQNEELERLRLAIENEKQTLVKINCELQEAFANDIHFKNEIESITKNNRYLTKEELIKYLQSIIRMHLSSVRFITKDDNISELEIPSNNKQILFNFIEQYKDPVRDNPEMENLYRKFKARHNDSKNITLTFDQQFAYRHKGIEFISAFHPLVNAVTNYLIQNGFEKNQAYKLSIKSEYLKDSFVPSGYYILCIYRITVTKNFGDGRSSQFHLLRTALADPNGNTTKILERPISEQVHGILQLKGEQMFGDPEVHPEIVQQIRNSISFEMIKDQDSIREDESLKFFSAIRRRTEQEINYLKNRIGRIEKMLVEGKGIEAILRKEIVELRNKETVLAKNQEQARIDVNHAVISINLLEVI